MTIIYSNNLDAGFADVAGLQAAGVAVSGSAQPGGIGDSLSIVGGVMVSTLTETDAPTLGGKRSEIVPTSADALGDERWYTWDVLAQGAAWADDACNGDRGFTLMQIHDKDGGPVRAPCFGMLYDGRHLYAAIPQAEPPAESPASKVVGAVAAAPGAWYSCALYVKWDNAGLGELSVFVNRVALVKRLRIGTAYNADAPYLKLGVYNGQSLTGYGERSALYRNVRVRSFDSFVSALGGVPLCPAMSV